MADGQDLVIGAVNLSSAQTHLQRSGAGSLTAFSVLNLNGGGIVGSSSSSAPGVEGASDTGAGIRGASNTGEGVAGVSNGGVGVQGLSTEGDGVVGITQVGGSGPTLAAGVRGFDAGGNGVGVWGESPGVIGSRGSSDTGTGVAGSSVGGVGVLGTSEGNDGVSGTSVNGSGVVGFSNDNVGVYGRCQRAGVVGECSGDPLSVGVGGYAGAGYGVSGSSSTGPGVGGFSDQVAVYGFSGPGDGVRGLSKDGHGVEGFSDKNAAVFGSSPSAGVLGLAPNGNGVEGRSTAGVGVRGTVQTGRGVFGTSRTGNGVEGATEDAAGVRGSSSSDGVGVVGQSLEGRGVVALSAGGDALVATSTRARGVVGTSASTSGTGVVGIADATGPPGFIPSTAGVAGTSRGGVGVLGSTATGLAGFFVGPVVVSGNVIVTGAKSAAVPHPDGSHRLTYALESPESWFEDFGRAELVDGHVTVPLDPEFVALVAGDDYHVFLTPEGDCAGLYVDGRSREGFEVRELQDGHSTLAFSYRVAARRGDLEARRLERVDLPSPPEIRLDDVPGPEPVPVLDDLSRQVTTESRAPLPKPLPPRGGSTATAG